MSGSDHRHDLGQIRNEEAKFHIQVSNLKNRREPSITGRALSRGDSLTLFSIGVSWTFN